jgi:hypothetical protein
MKAKFIKEAYEDEEHREDVRRYSVPSNESEPIHISKPDFMRLVDIDTRNPMDARFMRRLGIEFNTGLVPILIGDDPVVKHMETTPRDFGTVLRENLNEARGEESWPRHAPQDSIDKWKAKKDFNMWLVKLQKDLKQNKYSLKKTGLYDGLIAEHIDALLNVLKEDYGMNESLNERGGASGIGNTAYLQDARNELNDNNIKSGSYETQEAVDFLMARILQLEEAVLDLKMR